MNLISYRDYCQISRITGKDEWDNSILSPIYEGPCLYEEGTSSYYFSFVTRQPVLFIPEWLSELVQINDSVKITTEAGREINGVVKIVRDINLSSIVEKKLTRVEIKQAQGD